MAKVRQSSTKRAQYDLVSNSYSGEGGYTTGSYLFKFGRELSFEDRKKMSSYTNFMRPIVDARVLPIFATPAQREYDNDIINLFLNDADNNGTHLEEYIKGATINKTLLGNSFIIMDNFNDNDLPSTVGEAIQDRRIPYIYSKQVQDVYEYDVDEFGEIIEITFFYGVDKKVNVYKSFTKTSITKFTMEKTIGTSVIEGKRTIISNVSHNLAVVPVVYMSEKVLPFPPYYSMSTLARKIYNIDSEIGDLSRTQSFSILLIPSTAPGDDSNDIVVSKHSALFYDSDAKNQPEYISPDSTLMTTSLNYRSDQMDTFIKTADVLGTSATITGGNDASSGIALSYKFFGKTQELLESSIIATYYETEIIKLLGLFCGEEFEYSVSYPATFAPSFAEVGLKVGALENLAALNLSDEINTAANSGIVKLLGGVLDVDNEELGVLIDSIGTSSSNIVNKPDEAK